MGPPLKSSSVSQTSRHPCCYASPNLLGSHYKLTDELHHLRMRLQESETSLSCRAGVKLCQPGIDSYPHSLGNGTGLTMHSLLVLKTPCPALEDAIITSLSPY